MTSHWSACHLTNTPCLCPPRRFCITLWAECWYCSQTRSRILYLAGQIIHCFPPDQTYMPCVTRSSWTIDCSRARNLTPKTRPSQTTLPILHCLLKLTRLKLPGTTPAPTLTPIPTDSSLAFSFHFHGSSVIMVQGGCKLR